jgi:hypothetical protein
MSTNTLASSNRWALAVAVLLVIPGTALSVVLGAIGALILLLFFVDWAAGGLIHPTKRLQPILQVVLTFCLAAAIGGLIGLGAWLI